MSSLDWWRITNAWIALLALVFTLLDLKERYRLLSRRHFYLMLALAMLLLTVVVGSIQAIYQKNPLGPRTTMVTVSCLWCIIGLWISRNDKFE